MAKRHKEYYARKKFLDNIKNKENFNKEKNKREKERILELKDKVKTDINYLNNPIPVNYDTFSNIAKKNGGYNSIMKKNKEMSSIVKCFGTGPRFELDENQKWKKKIEMWNKNETEKPIDPNIDATPGPAKYSLVSTWKPPKNDEKNPLKKNYFNMLSNGPYQSIYYH
jgi:hypothetical protein